MRNYTYVLELYNIEYQPWNLITTPYCYISTYADHMGVICVL